MSKETKTIPVCVALTVDELKKQTKNKAILEGVQNLPGHCVVFVDPKEINKKAKSE